MNRWRVGEDRGSKEIDGCPLTASSTVSGHLVEAFAKNSMPKGFEDIVLTTLHKYANVFSQTTFDSLPKRCK
jgi:hypothetical protein